MIKININRVTVALHGVSAQVVESAVKGLEEELHRRLGSLPPGISTDIDIGELSLGPVRNTSVLDGAALRGIIAEQLAGAVRARFADITLSDNSTTARAGGG